MPANGRGRALPGLCQTTQATESATENIPPAGLRRVRVKWCGKSAPRPEQSVRQGKPHAKQDQIGEQERPAPLRLPGRSLEPGRDPALLLISSAQVDASNVFLRHKTTQRPIHNQALAQAQAAGCDDALIFNTEGQVTECAIHNVMIAKGARWITPPVECGLLPGVYRQQLLARHPEIEETAIHLEDVLSADRIFIFNSVRGLRLARLWHPRSG